MVKKAAKCIHMVKNKKKIPQDPEAKPDPSVHPEMCDPKTLLQ